MQILLNSIALEPNRWTEDRVPRYALEDLLEPIRGAGFSAVEVWQFHLSRLDAQQVRSLKEKAERLGITFPVLGVYPVFHLKGAEREGQFDLINTMLAAADELGSRALKLMPGSVPSAEITQEQWDSSVAFVREVAGLCEERDMFITCETHGHTLADDPEVLLRFFREVGSDRLKVCWQPFDMADTEAAIALYDRLAGHVAHLHLQGNGSGRAELLELSDIDYRRVLSHIFQKGFDGYAGIEFVRDCLVPADQFDMDLVLSNAVRDREFIEAVARDCGMQVG